jgi:hypothetical protein
MESDTGGVSFLRVIILSENRLDPRKAGSSDFYVAHLIKVFGLTASMEKFMVSSVI